MAAKVNKTGKTAQKNIKPSYIVATLFTGKEVNDTPLGDTYILEDVVQDSVSISQDDNETTDIECETSDSPIVSIVKLGKCQVAAEVGDTQADLLVNLCGFTKSSDGKKVYAPSIYEKKHVKFDIVFKKEDGTYSAFVVPKLQLNAKITIESLNSNLGRIALAGTAQDITITVGEKDIKTPFYTEDGYTLPTEAGS